LVFYCRRRVDCLDREDDALKFLGGPLPAYLFVPAREWEALAAKAGGRCRLLGRHRDLYRNCDVVVVSNR
ncbi:MAG TPA: hypothetical protein VFA26_14435, partial [Gemmataceae bacterium]|nr:hypothetical protein [Gemmataceae bacterium]